ncbi:hypothetical protein KSP40_PGU001884 [Platanthera guangdongensis]|uniref:Uncharacterized protein n=1 Tax=Platanthera guangdongensis TaxID=2320717 RepID=A0ABR2MTU4_9ASPA
MAGSSLFTLYSFVTTVDSVIINSTVNIHSLLSDFDLLYSHITTILPDPDFGEDLTRALVCYSSPITSSTLEQLLRDVSTSFENVSYPMMIDDPVLQTVMIEDIMNIPEQSHSPPK